MTNLSKISDARRAGKQPLTKEREAQLIAIRAALERSYQRACEVAKLTDTYLVVQRNGQLVKLKVN